jgi:hypothetical protein
MMMMMMMIIMMMIKQTAGVGEQASSLRDDCFYCI